jgi:hypothetical protein
MTIRTWRAPVAALALALAGGLATGTVTAAPAAAATTPEARSWKGRCEAWVHYQFGRGGQAFPTAMANWRHAVRTGVAVRGDTDPPAGMLVFWNVARGRGHVGISLGNGMFRDYNGVQPLDALPRYLGWAPPRYHGVDVALTDSEIATAVRLTTPPDPTAGWVVAWS